MELNLQSSDYWYLLAGYLGVCCMSAFAFGTIIAVILFGEKEKPELKPLENPVFPRVTPQQRRRWREYAKQENAWNFWAMFAQDAAKSVRDFEAQIREINRVIKANKKVNK